MQTKANQRLHISYVGVTRVELTMAEIIESMEKRIKQVTLIVQSESIKSNSENMLTSRA